MDRDLERIFYECLHDTDIMTPSGALNLALCYPRNGALQPDLGELGDTRSKKANLSGSEGPKMYAGMVSWTSGALFTLLMLITRQLHALNCTWTTVMP